MDHQAFKATLEPFTDDASYELGLETVPSRRAKPLPYDERVDQRIVKRFDSLGIAELYCHQSMAISAALDGRDVIVSTGTNSGKSLCYAIPILQACLHEPLSRSILIYPTKALAQDQISKWATWSDDPHFRAATYDGDTPKNQRGSIRNLANVVATNPDMLHIGILPGHENWIRFLKSLRYIVIDEAHAFRGVFGSHVSWILRRLLRLCEFYGSRPQVIACSATLGNPIQHFEALSGRVPVVVDDDGSPQGKRHFAFINPLPDEDGNEPSRNMICAKLLCQLAESGIRSMAFSRSRIGVELVLKYARDIASRSELADPKLIESYRAGYTVEERRQIELKLFSGELLGLSATTAMELGVDVGGLDAAILNGFPGSVSSFWQQSGRAGRGTAESAVFCVAADDPLDQYLSNQPGSLLHSVPDQIRISPMNRSIAESQINCMAHEKPLSATELMTIHTEALSIAESMDASGQLEFRAGRFFFPAHEAPASKVDIRGSGGTMVELRVGATTLGSMESWRASRYAHEGAIYLHRGDTYRVKNLDIDSGIADLEAFSPDYFTEPIVQSIVEPLAEIRSKKMRTGAAMLCSLRVTTTMTGYRRRSIEGRSIVGVHELELPPQCMETIGMRWSMPSPSINIDPEVAIAGIHGIEHALMAVAPLFACCDRNDLGSAWYYAMADSMAPSIFVFDAYPGGIGLSESIWLLADELWEAARRLLETCKCEHGCPRCLYSPRCEISNACLDKEATIQALRLA